MADPRRTEGGPEGIVPRLTPWDWLPFVIWTDAFVVVTTVWQLQIMLGRWAP